MSKEKKGPLVKCAECMHCKQYREFIPESGRYTLKVKCAKGHWRVGRKHGACDLHRVMARRRHGCMNYVSSSDNEKDRQQFLEHLANTLPIELIYYEPNGEPADFIERSSWTRAM